MRSAAVRLSVALAVAAILTSAPAANAGLVSGLLGAALPGCGAVSYPFAQFGDTGAYCTPANNGFESGAAGWTLSPAEPRSSPTTSPGMWAAPVAARSICRRARSP